MAKKWVSPLEKMMASENTATATVEELTERIIANKVHSEAAIYNNTNSIIEIDPDTCVKWQFKDRPESELGDLDDLAENLKINGQIHPVLIRKNNNGAQPYELIVGERRWLAAKKAGIPLKAIFKENLSDQDAAILQVAENDKRKDLSDYAKGIMLKQQVDAGIITTKDVESKLNKSQSYVRNLLSFSRLSHDLITAIGDMKNISARTAYELVLYQEKSEAHKLALLELAPTLRNGKIGEKQLEKLIDEILNNLARQKHSCEILSKDGRHLFSWRGDTNKNRSISFPKTIRQYIDFNELEEILVRNIEDQLKKRQKTEG